MSFNERNKTMEKIVVNSPSDVVIMINKKPVQGYTVPADSLIAVGHKSEFDKKALANKSEFDNGSGPKKKSKWVENMKKNAMKWVNYLTYFCVIFIVIVLITGKQRVVGEALSGICNYIGVVYNNIRYGSQPARLLQSAPVAPSSYGYHDVERDFDDNNNHYDNGNERYEAVGHGVKKSPKGGRGERRR